MLPIAVIPANIAAQQWDFFFFFAFLIGIYSIHRLATIKEVGEVEEEFVAQELISEVRRGMRNFSTAGGPIQTIQFPIVMVGLTPVGLKKNKKAPKNRVSGRE